MLIKTHGDGKITDPQLFHDIQHQVADLVGDILAVRIHAGKDDVLIMLGVSAARRGIAADPLAAFDKQAGQYLPGFVQGENSRLQIPAQIVSQHLIDAADTRPVAAQPGKGKGEPQTLHRFEKIARRFKRNPHQGRAHGGFIRPQNL